MNIEENIESKLSEKEVEFQWIERTKKDKRHFAPLYDKYYEQIFRFILQRVEDMDIAEDICSQVFYKAITKIHQFNYQGYAFSSWLYRISFNTITDYYRKQKKQRVISIQDTQLKEFYNPEEDQDTELLHRQLSKALQYLSHKEMTFIEMRFFEERPFKEIAEILNLTEVNTKAKTYRILSKLHSILKKLSNHE